MDAIDVLNIVGRGSHTNSSKMIEALMFLMWYNEKIKDEMYYMHPNYHKLANKYFKVIDDTIMGWEVDKRTVTNDGVML